MSFIGTIFISKLCFRTFSLIELFNIPAFAERINVISTFIDYQSDL